MIDSALYSRFYDVCIFAYCKLPMPFWFKLVENHWKPTEIYNFYNRPTLQLYAYSEVKTLIGQIYI